MNLLEATDKLYRVFARYPGRTDMEGCRCCVSPKDSAELAASNLREITPKSLEHYAFKATSTWGDLDDYKHFLPRILELATDADASGYDGLNLELIAKKLSRNGWAAWPDDERNAIRGFLMVWWEEILSSYQSLEQGPEDPEFLLFIAYAVDDLSPWLECWAENRELPALRLLSDFIVHEMGDLLQAKYFWGEISQREPLVEWFSDPARGEALDAGIDRFIDEPDAEILATGLDFWRSMTGHAAT